MVVVKNEKGKDLPYLAVRQSWIHCRI